jgi:hypothetical protein
MIAEFSARLLQSQGLEDLAGENREGVFQSSVSSRLWLASACRLGVLDQRNHKATQATYRLSRMMI